jgi:hypothetical protein
VNTVLLPLKYLDTNVISIKDYQGKYTKASLQRAVSENWMWLEEAKNMYLLDYSFFKPFESIIHDNCFVMILNGYNSQIVTIFEFLAEV